MGVAIDLASGLGVHTRSASLDARLLDNALGLNALLRLRASATWSFALAAGPALHLTLLRGRLPGSGREVEATRVPPHLRSEVRLEWHTRGLVVLAVWGQAGLALLAQRYWLGEQRVLEGRRVTFAAGLSAAVSFRL